MLTSAHVLILSPQGELILQLHSTNPDVISTWGGATEGNETPMQTLRRELQEELGLNVPAAELIPWKVYTKTKKLHGEDRQVHLFTMTRRLDPTALTIYEGEGYVLVQPTDNLDQLPLSRAAHDFVPDFFKEKLA